MERKLREELIYRGRILSLRRDEVILPHGGIAGREVVEHLPAVAVLPVLDGRVLLVRQFRYAVGEELLEVPAGLLKEGESPEECAVREMREETGYRPLSLKKVLTFYTSPGFSDEVVHLYFCDEMVEDPLPQDDDEGVTLSPFPIEDLRDGLRSGLFKDAKTILALSWLLTEVGRG